jgi:hypothetical protein
MGGMEMSNKRNEQPPVAFRVFVSSTYVDMQPYREAIRNALNKADCVPYGMERFGAASISPLEKCYEELEKSQIYLCALGMKYGSIDDNTQKSYTELEYEKARELGKPILAFLIDEDKAEFKVKDIDKGELWDKLVSFKENIKNSKEVTCSFFDSVATLEEAVYRSVLGEIKRQGARQIIEEPEEKYIEGAKLFSRFVKRPERYKNIETILRVRMDGLYGGWRLRPEVCEAFGFIPGDTLFLNGMFVIGTNVDVESDIWHVECLAEDRAADWLDDNKITTGTIFEGRFKLAYELVEMGAGNFDKAVDAKIASLILIEGIKVVSR